MILSVYAAPRYFDISAILDELSEYPNATVYTNSKTVVEAAGALGLPSNLLVPDFRFLSAALPLLACKLAFAVHPEVAIAFTIQGDDACLHEFLRIAPGFVRRLIVV